jgi:hypothetical protein
LKEIPLRAGYSHRGRLEKADPSDLDHTFGNIACERQQIPIMAPERATVLMEERYAALQHVDKAPLLAPLEH